jgi:hypothetical protein
MPFHLYRVVSEEDTPRWFGIRVEYDEDHWVSRCCEVTADGTEKPGTTAIAPKFYGVTAEQAHRRMLDVLENTYGEVTPAGSGAPS